MSTYNLGPNGSDLNLSVINRPLGTVSLVGTVGSDLIIPENVSDSTKILKTDCQIKIKEITAENSSINILGTAFFTVLLLGDDAMLASVNKEQEFELREFVDSSDLSIELVFKDLSCVPSSRLLNPRKLNVSANIEARVYAFGEQSVNPIIKGAESIDDELSLKRLCKELTYVDTFSIVENEIPISHDIHLDGNYPPMSEIVYRSVRITPIETVSSGNEITVKSKVTAAVIYRSEEGNVFSIEKPFIAEKTILADNAESYEWLGLATVNDVTAEIAIDGYGETKLIELDLTYDIILNGSRNASTEAVTDAYSTEYDCDTYKDECKCNIYKRAYGTSLSINAFGNRSDINAENVRAVMLGDVSINQISSEYSDEKKRLIIDAAAFISAVCEDNIMSDDDPRFSSLCFEYPFKCELDIGENPENSSVDITINVTDVRFRCDQNKIYCDFENDIKATVSEERKYEFIREIALNKGAAISGANAPITLCYPSGSETLWDIAKYYKVRVEDVMRTNDLLSESIEGKKVLLIPSHKRSAPAYTVVN